jgi:hypothetical protein
MLAVDFLESVHEGEYSHDMSRDAVVDKLKAVLASPQVAPEVAQPVAWQYRMRVLADDDTSEWTEWREAVEHVVRDRMGRAGYEVRVLGVIDPPQAVPQPLTEDAKDAARYRWLRDVGDATWRPFAIREGYSAAQADDAIDAAMAKEPKT